MSFFFGSNDNKATKVILTGLQGEQGPAGPAGQGVPEGGSAGQILSKIDSTNYNTQWIDMPSVDTTNLVPKNSSDNIMITNTTSNNSVSINNDNIKLNCNTGSYINITDSAISFGNSYGEFFNTNNGWFNLGDLRISSTIIDNGNAQIQINNGSTGQLILGANKIVLSGPVSVEGYNLNMNSRKITGLVDPESYSDAATKQYVDDHSIPKGGTNGQVLTKTSNGVAWSTPSSGNLTYTSKITRLTNYAPNSIGITIDDTGTTIFGSNVSFVIIEENINNIVKYTIKFDWFIGAIGTIDSNFYPTCLINFNTLFNAISSKLGTPIGNLHNKIATIKEYWNINQTGTSSTTKIEGDILVYNSEFSNNEMSSSSSSWTEYITQGTKGSDGDTTIEICITGTK